jgi:hypothetical protein
MTIEGDVLPKELKVTKVSNTNRLLDEQRETYNCACKKGGSCFRETHQEGLPCEMQVTLSKTNRHKVCNQCRKNKSKKLGSVNSSVSSVSMQDRVVPLPPSVVSLNPDAYHAIPLTMQNGLDLQSAIPHISMSHDGSLQQVPSMSVHVPTGMPQHVGSNSNGLPNKLPCSCEKGGNCSRAKHFEGQTCDRTVTITKNDKHTRCKGCRYTKKRKTGTLVDSRNISQMDIPMVPSASVGHMVSMNHPGPMTVPSLHSVPLPLHHDVVIPHHL